MGRKLYNHYSLQVRPTHLADPLQELNPEAELREFIQEL
jgi:hypothetical protein